MPNIVNKWIIGDGTHEGKKKRRLLVAVACAVGAVACLLAGPIGLVGAIPLGVIALVKVKNAATDNS